RTSRLCLRVACAPDRFGIFQQPARDPWEEGRAPWSSKWWPATSRFHVTGPLLPRERLAEYNKQQSVVQMGAPTFTTRFPDPNLTRPLMPRDRLEPRGRNADYAGHPFWVFLTQKPQTCPICERPMLVPESKGPSIGEMSTA